MKRFFNNLSTRAKFILGFGAIWLLLAAVIVTAYVSITGIARSEQKLRDKDFQIILHLANIMDNLSFNRIQILTMMETTDRSDQEVIKQTILERAQETDTIIEALLPLDPDAWFQSKIQEFKNGMSAYRQTREQEIALLYTGKVKEAVQLDLDVGAGQFEKIRLLSIEIVDHANDEADQQLAQDQQSARSSVILFMIIGAIALLLGVGMVVVLNQTIASPLVRISKFAEQIAGGDLTINLPTDQRRDEVGALSQAFRRMTETLRRSVSDISEAVSLLGSSASDILAATTQVASGTAETATAISETTTTVEEVRQAAQLSSQKAQSVSESTQRVDQSSQSGQKAVEETVAGMERIREQMENIAQTVVLLSEQSQSIGGIIATVNDLADQSNLLAVNAAIEAAKAGEQGKGFAVVAQEIKSLAEQSKQATAQVRGILSDVQKATGNAVMATEQGSKAVEAGVKQSEQAGEAIRALSETSSEAMQATVQIVASSQQQVVGMDQIGVAMENINQAGAQTAASMKQAEIAAQNLHELGQKLKKLVEQFKV